MRPRLFSLFLVASAFAVSSVQAQDPGAIGKCVVTITSAAKSVKYSNPKGAGKSGKNILEVQGIDAGDKLLLDWCEITIFIP